MPFHGAWADEELRTDLRVRSPVPRKPRDLLLLRREFIARVVSALAHLLARGQQLATRALRESLRAHRGEHLVRSAQLLAGIDPPTFATQPFAVGQPSASQVRRHATLTEQLDRLPMKILGSFTFLDERARARLGSLCPLGAAGTQSLRQAIQGVATRPPAGRFAKRPRQARTAPRTKSRFRPPRRPSRPRQMQARIGRGRCAASRSRTRQTRSRIPRLGRGPPGS